MSKQLQKLLLLCLVSTVAMGVKAQERNVPILGSPGDGSSLVNDNMTYTEQQIADSKKSQTIYDLRPKFEGKVGFIQSAKKDGTQIGIDLTELNGNPQAIAVLIENLKRSLPNFTITRGNIYTNNFLLVYNSESSSKELALSRCNSSYNTIWAKVSELGSEKAEEYFKNQQN